MDAGGHAERRLPGGRLGAGLHLPQPQQLRRLASHGGGIDVFYFPVVAHRLRLHVHRLDGDESRGGRRSGF